MYREMLDCKAFLYCQIVDGHQVLFRIVIARVYLCAQFLCPLSGGASLRYNLIKKKDVYFPYSMTHTLSTVQRWVIFIDNHIYDRLC